MAERADAARNRAAVLAAAEDLFATEPIDHVTLARLADSAKVGKATVLRRFGDVSGVVEAVLAPRVAALQEALRSGPAPLGPGGQDSERIHAYLDALLDFVLDNWSLIRALEHRRLNAYYANPASQFWIDELSHRLHAADPTVDSGYLAHAVFTAMRADVIDYLRQHQQMSTERIRSGIHTLVDRNWHV